jgi:demethylsterigmatocystin 6-O-methyltransferase
MRLPSLLQERGWTNPTDSKDNAMARAWNKPEGTGLFEIILGSPHLAAFNLYMSAFNEGHRDWTDFYPAADRLGRGASADPAAVMMVDVGGGQGHQAQALKAKFPQLPGRFVVQDLAQGLPKHAPAGVECMRHDFFREQPVKGACETAIQTRERADGFRMSKAPACTTCGT